MVANNFPLKIGLFGIGLEAYWEQFEGLQKRLAGYVDVVAGIVTFKSKSPFLFSHLEAMTP